MRSVAGRRGCAEQLVKFGITLAGERSRKVRTGHLNWQTMANEHVSLINF